MFNFSALFQSIVAKVRPPVVVVMGSPREAALLASRCAGAAKTCYQMDLHQAARLREILDDLGCAASVEVHPDLWDLGENFQTVLLPIAKHGERELKLDLVEQSSQILRYGGLFIALCEYESDQLVPRALKKYYGKCHELPAARDGSVFWSALTETRPRRRHELTFHARIGDGPSHSFISQPGVFSYGRMDDGARALLEVAEIHPGNAILDLGCGVGTNGIIAADRAGLDAPITFVDSNVRAIALAEHNARNSGLTQFACHSTAVFDGLPPAAFDVILANPPYYAASAIATAFIEQSRPLLKEGGRFYLVTKQVEHVAPYMVEKFGDVNAFENRGYTIVEASLETHA
jgi:16S rRNA (guanine1207-N2)-methyltransferase